MQTHREEVLISSIIGYLTSCLTVLDFINDKRMSEGSPFYETAKNYYKSETYNEFIKRFEYLLNDKIVNGIEKSFSIIDNVFETTEVNYEKVRKDIKELRRLIDMLYRLKG